MGSNGLIGVPFKPWCNSRLPSINANDCSVRPSGEGGMKEGDFHLING